MDYIVHGVAKSWTRLSDFYFLSLVRSHLFIFVFISIALGGGNEIKRKNGESAT